MCTATAADTPCQHLLLPTAVLTQVIISYPVLKQFPVESQISFLGELLFWTNLNVLRGHLFQKQLFKEDENASNVISNDYLFPETFFVSFFLLVFC